MSKKKQILINIIIFTLGLLFFVAGISKLFPLDKFLLAIQKYNLPFLSFEFLEVCSVPLIALEVWLGMSLILRINIKNSLLLIQGLLIIMIPITIWGIFQDTPSCGCYGELVKRPPWMATIEDIILLTISFYTYLQVKYTPMINNKRTIICQIITLIVTIASALIGMSQLCHM